MTTTPQTVTLPGEDYVAVPRDEYERPRAAAAEDAATIQRVLADPDETWPPAELVRRIVEANTPCASGAPTAPRPPARWPWPRASRPPTSPLSSAP